jgi:hypothetical protein
MDAEEDNTVIRPRAIPDADAAIPDDDTIIRDRVPFADLAPIFEEVARRAGSASEPFALVEPRLAPPAQASAPRVEPARAPVPPVGDSSRAAPVYRFRVNNHEPIALDAPAILGRKPSAPRVTKGALARLVRVPSPLREVSSTHLELRQHGASVIVTDLRSTNGTIITVPGFSAQKLLQGESVVVSAGTVVDIGDGNLVEILPVERVSVTGG